MVDSHFVLLSRGMTPPAWLKELSIECVIGDGIDNTTHSKSSIDHAITAMSRFVMYLYP